MSIISVCLLNPLNTDVDYISLCVLILRALMSTISVCLLNPLNTDVHYISLSVLTL